MSRSPLNLRPTASSKLAAYVIGAMVVAIMIAAIVLIPRAARFYAKGPANTGHDALACQEFHNEAPGTTRQQAQAKVRYWLGLRASDVAFGHVPVGNAQCTGCHARDQDAHPVHRFLEPRFAQARAELGAHSCVSCHREHKGGRVTMALTACSSCHQDLELKRDPLDVPHRTLIASNNWVSCLGCHDYHGNHKRTAQTHLDAAYSAAAIIEYLAGGPSPYGNELKFRTKSRER